jgi:hypothetical protein
MLKGLFGRLVKPYLVEYERLINRLQLTSTMLKLMKSAGSLDSGLGHACDWALFVHSVQA